MTSIAPSGAFERRNDMSCGSGSWFVGFEVIGNADEIRLVQQRLIECENRLQEAREALHRRQEGIRTSEAPRR
jgi:hypothetical protein